MPFPSAHLKLDCHLYFCSPKARLSLFPPSSEAWLSLPFRSPKAWFSLLLSSPKAWLSPFLCSPERHPATWDTRHSRAFLHLFAHWNQGAGGAHAFHTEQNITSTVEKHRRERTRKERLRDFVMRIVCCFTYMRRSRSYSRSLLEFLLLGGFLICYLEVKAWLVFSQFFPVFLYCESRKIFLGKNLLVGEFALWKPSNREQCLIWCFPQHGIICKNT